jgi:soluble cytochrome b562
MTYTHRIKNGVRVDLTAEEITALENKDTQWNNGALDRALTELRQIRNNLLKATDWYANSDLTMSSDMTAYRQALRDLTNGLDTVAKVQTKLEIEDGKYINFPIKPGA